MTNFSNNQLQRSLTTGFKSSLFPLYETVTEPPVPAEMNAPQLSNITQLGINIYCPNLHVEDYEHLICQEVSLRRSRYNRHQPVASVWWLGSPLQQFSPEAITELCFRLSSHFTHQQEGSTRGMAVTPMELDRNNLALIKGLKFNAIQLNIDASVASGDRSLSKIETALQILDDYKSFDLSCVIKFSDQTHQEFLDRLLNLLQDSHCTHIEVLSQKSGPVTLQDKLACQNQLTHINSHFCDCAWRTCGNNNFFAPSHSTGYSQHQTKIEATPWGYLTKHISSWLGFGVGALSFNNGDYQYNTPSSEQYIALLSNNKLPVESSFHLRADRKTNFEIIQSLLCQHSVKPLPSQLHKQLTSLIPEPWLEQDTDQFKLNKNGILNLSSICDKLFEPLCA